SSSASPSRWGCCRSRAPPIRGTCRRTSPARPSISARTSSARSRRWGRNEPSSGALALELRPALVEPGDLGPGLLQRGVALLQLARTGGAGGTPGRYSTGLGRRLRGHDGLFHPLPLALLPVAEALRALTLPHCRRRSCPTRRDRLVAGRLPLRVVGEGLPVALAVEDEDAGRDAIEHEPVVGDEHEAALEFRQVLLQNL